MKITLENKRIARNQLINPDDEDNQVDEEKTLGQKKFLATTSGLPLDPFSSTHHPQMSLRDHPHFQMMDQLVSKLQTGYTLANTSSLLPAALITGCLMQQQ